MHSYCLVAKLHPTLMWPHELSPTRLLCPWNSPGKNTGVDCPFVLQRIFTTQAWRQVSCIGRQVLYCWATREAQPSDIAVLLLCTRKLRLREAVDSAPAIWYSNPGNVLTQKPVLSSAHQTPFLYPEHWHCLWKSVEIPSAARALCYDKARITAVIVTEQPGYIWQHPMKTRPLKGRLMPSHPFNSDLYLLIQLAFHIPVGKIQPQERERERRMQYLYCCWKFHGLQTTQVGIEFENLSPDFFGGLTNLPKDAVLALHEWFS